MAHRKFEFDMPAAAEVVFDAFHFYAWRARWDSLVSATYVQSGAPCPYVGAMTYNQGAGVLRSLSMTTRFVSFDRPVRAAAVMHGTSFPFIQWAATMQHRALDAHRSILVYTYTFQVGPRCLRWLLEPVVVRMFDYQTRRRFARLQQFLKHYAAEVKAWQVQSAVGQEPQGKESA